MSVSIVPNVGASDRIPPVLGIEKNFFQSVRALTSDLARPNPFIYWFDLATSVGIGYGCLIIAARAETFVFKLTFMLIATLALYRALLFIHELAHLTNRTPHGFWLVWNMTIGIPLLLPSFFYDGVHGLHHSKHTYGTDEDPEYLPLATLPKFNVLIFLLSSCFVPMLLLLRSSVVVPLAWFSPFVRKLLLERGSSLMINPKFRRRSASILESGTWLWLEVSATCWSWLVLFIAITGRVHAVSLVTIWFVLVGVALINQVRTLASHRWERSGSAGTIIEQFIDTVSVPPPALLPMLWAPLGLRYHALHHLIPELPYHALGEAHRRLRNEFAVSSTYNISSAPGFASVLGRILFHAVAKT